MIVSSYQETQPVLELPGIIKRDVVCADKGAPNFCMRVFDVEPGSSTPFHSHPWEHEVFVLSGEGVVKSDGTETQIARDSVIFVAPNEQHCFLNSGKKPLRFVCVIPMGTG